LPDVRYLDEFERRFMQTAFEVLVALEITIGFLHHDVALEQQALEHFLDVEAWVLGVACAKCNVFQVQENRHGGVRLFGRHSNSFRTSCN